MLANHKNKEVQAQTTRITPSAYATRHIGGNAFHIAARNLFAARYTTAIFTHRIHRCHVFHVMNLRNQQSDSIFSHPSVWVPPPNGRNTQMRQAYHRRLQSQLEHAHHSFVLRAKVSSSTKKEHCIVCMCGEKRNDHVGHAIVANLRFTAVVSRTNWVVGQFKSTVRNAPRVILCRYSQS